ncbi:unnamed protein product [Linum trigynum]|uniref:Retrotransposon gag domain-containing protein n=1 Tax=Linum trigynum TaxID=586398 RepID=A0AAV2GSD2_9ROSI
MVSTKSMKAAEKAAQAAEKGTDAGDVGLDGELEDLTEIEGLGRDHGRTLEALLAAVEALQGQVSSLTEAWKRGGAAVGDGEKPPEEKGAAEESASVAAVGGQGAEKGLAEGGAAASNPSRPPVSRPGQVSFGPTIKDGLLPTPSAQEMARARGKAKMAEYVDPGSHAGLNLEELVDPGQERDRGPWPNKQSGLGADGWREEGSSMGRAQWEGGPGGGWRESGRGWEPGRSGATGRNQSGRGDLGRAGMGRVPNGRAETGRTESGRAMVEPVQPAGYQNQAGSRCYPGPQGQFDEYCGPFPSSAFQRGAGKDSRRIWTGDRRLKGELSGRAGYQEDEGDDWGCDGDPRFTQHYYSGGPSSGRNAGHFRGGEEEDEMVFRARPPTIEFPKYNGREDAGLWLYSAERWFKNHPTREERKAQLASFYLEGDALQWWEWMERTYAEAHTLITWPMFKEELRYQFGKSEGWAPEQLAKLRQTGTVADYRAEFFKLGNQCKGVPEETLVGLCMAGLRPEIAAAVRVFELDSLRAVFRLADEAEDEVTEDSGAGREKPQP